MKSKPIFQVTIMAALLVAALVPTAGASALYACGGSYIVQPGDTLGGIAAQCGTTVAAIKLANPGLGYWIYAGQTLWLPGAIVNNGNGYATYSVARGDTLKALAIRFDTTMATLANLNGIYNYNLIYEGQRMTVPYGTGSPQPEPGPLPQPVPSAGGTYVVQWGDTMRKIAARMNVSLNDLIAVNPQIANPNLIFFGQVLNIPASASVYTIQRGDTLRIIAARFGTSVDALLALNPQIYYPDLIYAGQIIRVR